MQISKIFTLEAAHRLPDDKIYGDCSRLHGHSYKIEIGVSGPVSDEGWIINFKEISDIFREKIKSCCDHQNLNEVFPDMIITAEMLALRWGEILREAIQKKFGHLGVDLAFLEIHETETSRVRLELRDLLDLRR
ncbi:MAG: 6-carboxytetrahydropterin synthase [Candidatus Gracilibacteria bacterium]|nr:6-carboxytetrahydropterin synthase [Candidatus Gracilibacteria bacterium]